MMQPEDSPTPSSSPTIHFEGQVTGYSVQTVNKPDPWTVRLLGEDFVTVLLIIVFVIVVLSQIRVAQKKLWNNTSIRIVGITTIAFVAVFAGLTVNDPRNGPAVFGLLGTIAGYLLGRTDKETTSRYQKPDGSAESHMRDSNSSSD